MKFLSRLCIVLIMCLMLVLVSLAQDVELPNRYEFESGYAISYPDEWAATPEVIGNFEAVTISNPTEDVNIQAIDLSSIAEQINLEDVLINFGPSFMGSFNLDFDVETVQDMTYGLRDAQRYDFTAGDISGTLIASSFSDGGFGITAALVYDLPFEAYEATLLTIAGSFDVAAESLLDLYYPDTVIALDETVVLSTGAEAGVPSDWVVEPGSVGEYESIVLSSDTSDSLIVLADVTDSEMMETFGGAYIEAFTELTGLEIDPELVDSVYLPDYRADVYTFETEDGNGTLVVREFDNEGFGFVLLQTPVTEVDEDAEALMFAIADTFNAVSEPE